MHKKHSAGDGLGALLSAPLAVMIMALALAIGLLQLAPRQAKQESSFSKGFQWQIIHMSSKQERA